MVCSYMVNQNCHLMKKSGNRPNVGTLKSFGCRVYIRYPGINRHKMYNHVKKVNFIGYTATSSQIYYLDMDTKLVKTYNRVRFDEEMNYI